MFEKRKREYENQPLPVAAPPQSDDIRLAASNKRRRDGISSTVQQDTGLAMKRRRTANGPKEDLHDKGTMTISDFVDRPEAELQPESFKAAQHPETDSERPKRRHTKIDEMLGAFQKPIRRRNIFANHTNPHLTRSRESVNSDRYHEPIPPVEESIEEQRYSVKFGLGTKWKHPLVYPQAGKKKATVEFSDLPRLDEGQFLNDNLVEFYLRYLSEQLQTERPDIAKRVYWFNTYFYTSLTQSSKSRKINYDGVKKWTRNVDIFTHDYIIVPINESAHWYVAIICNLPAMNRLPPDISKTSSAKPQDSSTNTPELIGTNQTVVSKGNPTTCDPTGVDDTECDTNMNSNEALASRSFSELTLEDRPQSEADREGPAGQDAELSSKKEDAAATYRVPSSPQEELSQLLVPPDIEDIEPTDEAPPSSPTQARFRTPNSHRKPYTRDPDEPAIITLDSLGLAHSPATRALKEYLQEEAKDKRGGMGLEVKKLRGTTAKGIPQQDNFCDCGLYLLGYLDKFIENPKEFVAKVLQREFDESRDWPKLQPNTMRANIRELVQSLHSQQESDKKGKSKPLPRVSDQRPCLGTEGTGSMLVEKTAGNKIGQGAPGKDQDAAGKGQDASGKDQDAAGKAQGGPGKDHSASGKPPDGPGKDRDALKADQNLDEHTHEDSHRIETVNRVARSSAQPAPATIDSEPQQPDVKHHLSKTNDVLTTSQVATQAGSDETGKPSPIVLDSQEDLLFDQLNATATSFVDPVRPRMRSPEDERPLKPSPPRPRTRGKPSADFDLNVLPISRRHDEKEPIAEQDKDRGGIREVIDVD